MTPTELSLGFAQVQAPLGVVMLGISALLCALFIVYLLFQQAGALLEARRYAKEMKAQRELADSAEASRFTELRAFLEAEMRRLEAQGAASATRDRRPLRAPRADAAGQARRIDAYAVGLHRRGGRQDRPGARQAAGLRLR